MFTSLLLFSLLSVSPMTDIYVPDVNGTSIQLQPSSTSSLLRYRQEADRQPPSLAKVEALRRLAIACLEQGRKAEAISVCREMLASESYRTRAATSATDVATIAYESGDYQTATAIYDAVCDKWTHADIALRAREGQVKIAAFNLDEARAAAMADRFWADYGANPKSAQPMLRIAQAFHAHKGPAIARELRQRILASHPDTTPAFQARKSLLLDQIAASPDTLADQELDSLLAEMTPTAMKLTLAIADDVARHGRYARALVIYTRIVAATSQDDIALPACAGAIKAKVNLASLSDADTLLALAKLRFSTNPNLPAELLEIADGYRECARLVRARDLYNYIATSWPAKAEGIQSRLWLGAISATQEQDFASNLATTFTAVGISDKSEEALSTLVHSLHERAIEKMAQGQEVEGKAIAAKAARGWQLVLARFPEEQTDEALYAEAECLRISGRLEEAAACYRQCGERFPTSRLAATACFMAGECYRMLNESQPEPQIGFENKMVKAYKTVLNKYPGGPMAKGAAARLGIEFGALEGGVR